jgi:hypothetical protein
MDTPLTSEPKFYYLIRLNGEVVGLHRTDNKYGCNAMLGAYVLDPITRAEAETLQAFDIVEGFVESFEK